jgi:hypothetical protein
MSPNHVTPEGLNSNANPGASSGLAVSRLVIGAADANEVMREQLEYLIEHAGSGACGGSQCQRYLRARGLLMEIFADSRSCEGHSGEHNHLISG